ncbi:SNF7 family protein, putative isoform 3 [Theobroma cacao]|uniref:SNF7 family protein, putative isoform 3 n=1 Tax=Theobroma cacao TaxID=3641 RepID=A0A061DZM1_THECC|nr:SNF7 family protein, putative isoform 3 [Theobroma cacao]
MDSKSVREFIRKEVPDWDDELMATARFKAFSGQRSDWEPKFQFWKDLIIKISRQFGLFVISPSQVKNEWFNRGGLTPLCLDHVLGIKVSLSSAVVSSVSSLDFDTLHLIWTQEKLQQQLDVIDRRCEKSRQSALVSLKSGNKKLALRHAREMKLGTENREKCTSLLNRVEEVLNVIANAESTKKVTEAIQIGARAIKENKISVEEVHLCLEELDESIDSQKQVEMALESAPYSGIEDEDIEEEFRKLELEVGNENRKDPICEAGVSDTAGSDESLTEALLNLKLVDATPKGSAIQNFGVPAKNKDSNSPMLEAA